MGTWSRIKGKAAGGFDELVVGGLGRLGLVVVPFYLYREVPRSNPIGHPDGYQVRFLEGLDVTPLLGLDPAYDPHKLEARLREGKRCLIAGDAQRVVAAAWIDLEWCNFRGLKRRLGPTEAYVFDTVTHPECRGRGIAPWLRDRTHQALLQLGRDEIWSVSHAHNRLAVRFKEKIGAQRVSLGLFVQPFHPRLAFTVTVRRYACEWAATWG